MTNQISITRTDTGASISFPFELKDAFRSAFPSAKWSAWNKTWNVGTRSIKRLEQWVAEVQNSGALEALAARDEVEMSEKELFSLKNELETIKRLHAEALAAKAAADEARAQAEALRAQLDAAKAELEAAKAAAAAAEAAKEAVVADVNARVAHITTPARIEALRAQMRKHFVQKAWAKPHFEEARRALAEIRDRLEDAGIKCRAVDEAAGSNINRRDRDYQPLFMPIVFEAN